MLTSLQVKLLIQPLFQRLNDLERINTCQGTQATENRANRQKSKMFLNVFNELMF